MLRIPLPEYADGTLRKLTANSKPLIANLSLYPLVSSVPFSLHKQLSRLPCKAPHLYDKRKSVILGNICARVRSTGKRNAQHHAPSVRGDRI